VSESRRLVVSGLQPQVEGGRHALRRVVGDRLPIRAEILCDGDVAVRACILYRVPGESRWRPAPMQTDSAGVAWNGVLRLQNGGRTGYGVEAWVDVFGTWEKRLQSCLQASPPPDASSLRALQQDGLAVLEHAMQSATGADLRLLAERCEALRSAVTPADLDRWRRDRELHKRMLVYGERRHVVRSAPGLEVVVERRRAAFCTWCHLPQAVRLQPDVDAAVRLRRAAVDIVHFELPVGRQTSPVEEHRAAVEKSLESVEAAVDLTLPWALRPSWLSQHPEWFGPRDALEGATDADRRIDFWCEGRDALWQACLDVVLEHVRGGFRVVVAPHASQVPFAFWEWLCGRVHRLHPEVLFVNGPVEPTTARELARRGFSQSRVEWSGSLEQAWSDVQTWAAGGLEWRPVPTVPTRPSALATQNIPWSELRLTQLLAATCSGCFGMRGVPDVSEEAAWLQRLGQWRRESHVLQTAGNLGILSSTNPDLLALHRVAQGGRSAVLVIVNRHATRQQEGEVDLPRQVVAARPGEPVSLEDLVDGARYTWSSRRNFVRLRPHAAHVLRVVRRTGLLP
jgi:starch synthase (maltosyl-transferring)